MESLGLGDIFEEFTQEQDAASASKAELVPFEGGAIEVIPFDAQIPEQSNSGAFSHLTANHQVKKNYVSPAVRYITSLASKASQSTMHYALLRIAKTLNYSDYKDCPWEELNVDAVNFILIKLREEQLSPKTINTYLTAVKQVCKNAWQDHLMPHDTYLRISTIKGERGGRVAKGRSLGNEEIRDLLGTCRDFTNPINIRDAAIISLARGCGLRRQEITLLTMESINLKTGLIIVRGKGNKERKLSIPNEIVPIVNKWVEYKESYIWKNKIPEELFNPFHKTGKILARAITPMTIHNIFEERRKLAGLDKFSPHDLRRTFATKLLENDVEITDLQKMMGHSSVATTQIYDKRDDERILDIMKKASVF
ncbi:Integrase [Vibrio chagasii]|nr:Integrase [Vibrio chagasii]